VAAGLALLALAVEAEADARWGSRARHACLWAFVIACAVAWVTVAGSGVAKPLDPLTGFGGVLGWTLFALTWAAPPLSPEDLRRPGAAALAPPLAPRRSLPGGDAAYLAIAVVAAAALEVVGWGVAPVERALLVRLTCTAAAVAVVGSAAEVAGARLDAQRPRSLRERLRQRVRRGLVLAVLALAALGGAAWPSSRPGN
jgi:hypothetical protein